MIRHVQNITLICIASKCIFDNIISIVMIIFKTNFINKNIPISTI